ncbi:NAD-dependent epimerase/dehydratase family protein [Nesterenkonia populi]
MRIAVVGASGNLGTAVLHELAGREEAESVLGIARRVPNTDVDPYRQADWASIDIQWEESVDKLTEALSGVDAVIHLAWLIQPNTQRELLRRVNVDGTRHVLDAAAKAGVKHIAVASSVGAYSPVDDDEPRDETWPTEGIDSAHYSVDKAAQERVLDEFEAEHSDITLARIRPALIFQGAAASEIQRYFPGKLLPNNLLGSFRPPRLPMPAGVRTQAVHAKDAAVAFAEAAMRGAHGAYNIAADDILDGEAIASSLSNTDPAQQAAMGKVDSGYKAVEKSSLRVPSLPIRPLIKLAHRSRLLPMDEGWLDMAVHSPLMKTDKARKELGWKPSMTGLEALEELIDGMSRGNGAPSGPLRAKTQADASLIKHPLPGAGHRLDPERVDVALLRQYLKDHLTGATAGLERITAMTEGYQDTPAYPQLAAVAESIAAERAWLEALIERQGFSEPTLMEQAAAAGEKLARLKPFGTAPTERSPSEMVLETELMMGAITAKMHGWFVIADYAEELGVPEGVAEDLIATADAQRETLGEIHEFARKRAYRPDADPMPE